MKKYLLLLSFLAAGIFACSKGGGDKDEPNTTPVDPESYITGFYPNEVKPSSYSPCFAGAYYRKTVSSSDV
ncbi:MAG: hypothetical protein PHD21_03310 [Flavobacteriales bacterium]|nr:hypothetical protein [Flavobacteriales bacterium]